MGLLKGVKWIRECKKREIGVRMSLEPIGFTIRKPVYLDLKWFEACCLKSERRGLYSFKGSNWDRFSETYSKLPQCSLWLICKGFRKHFKTLCKWLCWSLQGDWRVLNEKWSRERRNWWKWVKRGLKWSFEPIGAD